MLEWSKFWLEDQALGVNHEENEQKCDAKLHDGIRVSKKYYLKVISMDF